jgi:hypothetical protein
MSSSHPLLGIPNTSFQRGFLTKIMYTSRYYCDMEKPTSWRMLDSGQSMSGHSPTIGTIPVTEYKNSKEWGVWRLRTYFTVCCYLGQLLDCKYWRGKQQLRRTVQMLKPIFGTMNLRRMDDKISRLMTAIIAHLCLILGDCVLNWWSEIKLPKLFDCNRLRE